MHAADPLPSPGALMTRSLVVRGLVSGMVCIFATQLRSLMWILDRHTWLDATTFRLPLAALSCVIIARYRTRIARWRPPVPRPSYGAVAAGRTAVVLWVLSVMLQIVAVLGLQGVFVSSSPAVNPPGLADAVVQTVITTPLIEEAVYRIVVLGVLLTMFGARTAVIIQATAFAVAHTNVGLLGAGAPASTVGYNVTEAVATGIAGLMFGYLTIETGRIWPAIAVHAFGNALTIDWPPAIIAALPLMLAVLLGPTVGVSACHLLARLPGVRRAALPLCSAQANSVDGSTRNHTSAPG